MKRLYKAVSVLMSLITVFSVFAIVPLEVSAAEGIEYIYRWWDSGAQEVKSETRICTDYTELNDRSSSYLGSNSSSVSWYVVKKDFWRPYYATHMQVTGTVNLIICDGVTFNAEAGIIVPENATLNIFGQSNGSGKFKVDLNVDKHREFTDRYTVFEPNQTLDVHLKISDVENGDYMIRETVLNRSNGSAFDLWVDMGALEPDTEEEFRTLRSRAIPMHSKYIQPVENGSLEADAILEMLEVRLITVTKICE